MSGHHIGFGRRDTAPHAQRRDDAGKGRHTMIENTLRRSAGSAVARIALAAFVLMLALSGLASRPEAAQAGETSVTLCTDVRYQGKCKTFYKSIPNLTHTEIGNDTLSSLKLPADMRVVLFEHDNYRGRCQVFTADTWTLVGSYIANDQATSVGFGWYSCPAPPKAPVSASGHYNHELGSNDTPLYSSAGKLGDTNVGNDSLWKIWVASGTTVALYSDIGFEGTCITIAGADKWMTLYSTTLGSSRASSIAINHSCKQDVLLCEDTDPNKKCVAFRSHKPDLTYTDLGNDTASGIRVPYGWKVFIYVDTHYNGASFNVVGPYESTIWWLATGVPNDSTSSIKVFPPSDCTKYACFLN